MRNLVIIAVILFVLFLAREKIVAMVNASFKR